MKFQLFATFRISKLVGEIDANSHEEAEAQAMRVNMHATCSCNACLKDVPIVYAGYRAVQLDGPEPIQDNVTFTGKVVVAGEVKS